MRIIFLPTVRCNLYCEYCYMQKLNLQFEEHSCKEWLQVFKKFPPSIVDISGGEPTVYPEFIKLVNNFPKKHKLALSTNLTQSLDYYKKIKIKFLSVTCSLHLKEFQKYGKEVKDFWKKAAFMESVSENLTVNFVDYPKQRKYVEKYQKLALKYGFRFNIEPYVDIQKDLGIGDSKLCYAGVDYIMIVPNGDVWRCNTAFNYHYFVKPIPEFKLGNVFDGTYKRLKNPKPCNLKCVHGCDLYQRGEYRGVLFG